MYQKNMHQNQLYLEKGICHREIFTFSKLRIFHRLRDAQWKPTSPLQRLLGQCERRYGQGRSKGNKQCSDGSIGVKLPAILGNSPNIRHRTNVRHLIIMFASLFPFFLLPVSFFPHFFRFILVFFFLALWVFTSGHSSYRQIQQVLVCFVRNSISFVFCHISNKKKLWSSGCRELQLCKSLLEAKLPYEPVWRTVDININVCILLRFVNSFLILSHPFPR